MPSSDDRPAAEAFDRLIEKLGPEIARRFRARGISRDEAMERVEEALIELAYRWNRVGDRERWLLKRLDETILNPPTAPGKEPEHE